MVACKSLREYNNNEEKIKQFYLEIRGELIKNNKHGYKYRTHQRQKLRLETTNFVATNKWYQLQRRTRKHNNKRKEHNKNVQQTQRDSNQDNSYHHVDECKTQCPKKRQKQKI